MKETEQTKLTDFNRGYCICSAYDNGHNEGGKVRLFECVLDGKHKTPCWYMLMPESTWYDKKSHKIENMLRRYFWRIRHFRWVRKWKDKSKEYSPEEGRRTRKKLSILRGILQTVLGFAYILVVVVFPVHPEIDKTGLPFILSLLIMCIIGVISCYWALNEFLSAYKDRDSLMN